MFTGIVEAVGVLRTIERRDGDVRAVIGAGTLDLADVKIGDSISTGGVCLTVSVLTADSFEVDISAETLACTTWNQRRVGDRLNLEKALAVGQRLGGHLVSGHVDGIGTLEARTAQDRSIVMRFAAPPALARYIAEKGSICIDGVSLTVNRIDGARFEVNLVPHTLEVTTLGQLQGGDAVNIEIDLIARYLERLLAGGVSLPT
ncbi:MAG: riboflavin synthase [Gammaproteobacteria bacterium]|nr:riboflavin synthase [Gammaproteobacteria bacterium]